MSLSKSVLNGVEHKTIDRSVDDETVTVLDLILALERQVITNELKAPALVTAANYSSD